MRERINKGPWYELDLELDRNDPWVWVRTNKDGRRYKVPLNPGDHPLFPGSKRKVSHPADARGYACAASNAYQTLLLDLFTCREWPERILDLAAGLVFPNDAALTNSYEEMVAYYQAVAEGVRTLRPDLVEELAPFSDRYGLDALPWGRGWLYTKVPSKWSDQQVEVPVTLPPITPTTERHPSARSG